MAIKNYKPTSPGRRNMSGFVFDEITTSTPEKSLLAPIKKKGGRNNMGRITVRHRGGGHKRRYRIIDFLRNKINIPAKVVSIEYDPNRSAFIALIIYEDKQTTYKDFDLKTEKVANGLVTLGVKDQDRVAFMDKNSDIFYEVVLGCSKANAVVVGINWRLAPPEVAYILNDSGAKVLFVGEEFFDLAEKILELSTNVEKVICITGSREGWLSFEEWKNSQSSEQCSRQSSLEDVAFQNLEKLKSRAAKGKISGSGDDR